MGKTFCLSTDKRFQFVINTQKKGVYRGNLLLSWEI